MAMWMDLADTDLCTRQSHLWPRWATSRIDRCIVRPGTPSGSKPPRTARWRNRTRWWPPLQGKKSQEIVRLGYLYSCIFTLDWTRGFTRMGRSTSVSFFIVFHGTTCLQVAFTAVETGQLSCSPSPEREGVLRQEVSCQSSLATVWWATDKYFHSAPGGGTCRRLFYGPHTSYTCGTSVTYVPFQPELFIKLEQVCK